MATSSTGRSTSENRRFIRNLTFGIFLGLSLSCVLRLFAGSNTAWRHLDSFIKYDQTGVDNPNVATIDAEISTNTETEQDNEIIESTTTIVKSTTTLASDSVIVKEFERQEGVAIVTKIHSVNHLAALEQSLCLLHHAYNNRVLYDIIVFSSRHINDTQLEPVRELVAPAKLTFVVDNPGLEERINALEPKRKAEFLQRCNITTTEELHWYMECWEPIAGLQRLAYTWQAEFRALHIWTHPALADYKYMLWFDTDAFCTKVWPRDPVAYMIQNDLVLFFDNFNAGTSRGLDWAERFKDAFNTTFCSLSLVDGKLQPSIGGPCRIPAIKQVHGFFHITKLDFYRSEPVMRWNRILIGDTMFSRRYDDQIGVTVPAAMYAANRSWEMGPNGIKLDVFHNGRLDGKRKAAKPNFVKIWNANATQMIPSAIGKCPITNAQ